MSLHLPELITAITAEDRDKSPLLSATPEASHSSPLATMSLALPDQHHVDVVNDAYSERLRCDHPDTRDGAALGEALIEAAQALEQPRIVALVAAELRDTMEEVGFDCEGVMPGFYEGQGDCAVLGMSLDEEREGLANPREVTRVDALLALRPPARARRARMHTHRATRADAPALAALLGATFTDYPTPSHEPAYVASQIAQGTIFRMVRDEATGEVMACASADLVAQARTAELTDCATRPEARGQGMMQAILSDLMEDLRAMNYPTAFTLARARIPGINLAFQRLGFGWRGRMRQSCRIGQGLEDMNIWSRRL